LLKENSDELKAGRLIDHLPQTFRDAVEVTRKFNIHYLWVDSLCIIQDSIDDWNKEALQMSQVYQHAICNIAATGAVDSTKGLFFDKNLHLPRPCKVSIRGCQATTDTETVYIVDPNFWYGRLEEAPLIQRAWVVQERLLAKRVLHFNQDQLYWECQQTSACEIFPAAMPKCMMFEGKFKDIVPNTGIPEMASKGPISPSKSREVIWRRVLSSYSRAQLSNPNDREAALSGIMKVLEGVFDDTCIAGLWRKGLPAQLAWNALPSATSTPTYRAPSWSWLSIDGEIAAGEIEAYAPLAMKEIDRGHLLQPRYVVAELKHIAITRAGESALSPITSGFIRLRGMLHPVTWGKITQLEVAILPDYTLKVTRVIGTLIFLDILMDMAWLLKDLVGLCRFLLNVSHYSLVMVWSCGEILMGYFDALDISNLMTQALGTYFLSAIKQ
jgi:hypothetical protein